MKQKVKRLIQDVQECAELLQQHGETSWAGRLRDDLKLLRKHGRRVLDDQLHLLRDADAFEHLRLSRHGGHLVSEGREDEVNAHLHHLRSAMRETWQEVLAGCA